MRIIPTLFMLMLILPGASALTADGIFELFLDSKDVVNANVAEVPAFFRNTFGDQDINIYLTLENGELLKVNVLTEDSAIESITKGESATATMEIRSNEKIVLALLETDDPLGVVYDGLDSNDITYKTLTFKTSLAIGTAKAGLRVYRFFSGLFG